MQVLSRVDQINGKSKKIKKQYVPRELADKLMEMFPERVTEPNTARDDIMYYAGIRKLVLTLNEWAYSEESP